MSIYTLDAEILVQWLTIYRSYQTLERKYKSSVFAILKSLRYQNDDKKLIKKSDKF